MTKEFMLTVLFSFAATVAGAQTGAPDASVADDFHAELTALTVGSFSTIDHARADNRYGVAEAEIVRIWPERDDGHWFYQEQAFLGLSPDAVDPAMKEQPYFARVIQSVEEAPGVVARYVHKLKSPEDAAGAWRQAAPLASLGPDDLEPSECSITVERIALNFWRSESEKCPNAYKGAAYALSLGVTTADGYANWDRGFTAEGEHVWGPASGGYVFRPKAE